MWAVVCRTPRTGHRSALRLVSMRSMSRRWIRFRRLPVPAVAAAVLVAVLGPALLAPRTVTTVTAVAAVHPHHADDEQDEDPVRCEPPHDGLLLSLLRGC